MAGERLAKLTLQASFSTNDYTRGVQTAHQDLRLAGSWIEYKRGGSTLQHEFVVPSDDPSDAGRDYVLKAVQNMLALVKLDIQTRGLAYTVSTPIDIGNDVITSAPKVVFSIEAGLYDPQLNLDFREYHVGNFGMLVPPGWLILQNLTTLQPLQVQQLVQPAGIYGSATGSIFLSVFGGNTRPLTYTWADDPTQTTEQRTGLAAGTYGCVVRDADGVSATVTCVVTSDAQLQVLVQQTEDSLTLVVSGGVAPYAVVWDDGPTVFIRTNLPAGTYSATVTDTHGASQRVTVTLLPNRCYFSHNPVRLALDAGAAYRLDPTTKPGLSFVAEVWVELVYRSGVFVQVGPQLEQPADLTGRTVFDVQALLDAVVAEHLPTLGGPVTSRAEGLFKRFYLKSAEKFGTPPVPAALATAQVHYVVCGGLSQEEAAAGTWPAYQAAVQPFLTWASAVQVVLPQQPAYLYYQHLRAGPESVQLWYRVTHTDGSSSVGRVGAITSVRRWEVYCLAVGPAQLGLTGADVVSYSYWVSDAAGVPLSTTATYQLDRAYYANPRFLLYSNSLGGVNVLAALGAAKHALEVVASEAARPAYDPDLGDVATLDRVGTATLSLTTGPRKRAQVYADQELLLSRRVTLLAGGRYWMGRVVAATFVVRDEAESLASLAFDFVLAKQRHFSPRLPLVVAGQAVTPVAGGEGARP